MKNTLDDEKLTRKIKERILQKKECIVKKL